MIGGDGYIERKLSSTESTKYVYVREEEWAEMLLMGRNCSARTSVGDRGVRKECTLWIPRSLVVELPATVGLGLCSAAVHDVSYESLFTALELSALKTMVGQACQRVRLHCN